MGAGAKQDPGKAGMERGQNAGAGRLGGRAHVPGPAVTNQADGHWTTCVCFSKQEGGGERPSHLLGLQARLGSRGSSHGC